MKAFTCGVYSGRQVRFSSEELGAEVKQHSDLVYADRDFSLWDYFGATYAVKRKALRVVEIEHAD